MLAFITISDRVPSQRLEQKRAEHERQKAEQKRAFAAQVCSSSIQDPNSVLPAITHTSSTQPSTRLISFANTFRCVLWRHNTNRKSVNYWECLSQPLLLPLDLTVTRNTLEFRRLMGIAAVPVIRASMATLEYSRRAHFESTQTTPKACPPADVTRVKMTIYWEWTSSLLVVSETLWQREVLLISIPTLHVSLTISPLCASRPFSKNGARHAQKLTNSSHDAPSVTSFLFDDELEADLQREYLHQCNLRISALNHAFPFTPIAGFLS